MFPAGGSMLCGILCEGRSPDVSRSDQLRDTAVLIIVGGPQYRAGSHRQFVLLARALAGAGFCTLRFDYRGMGDAEGVQRGFENVDDDIAAAVTTLLEHAPGARRVVLWGLCDGASAALMYLDRRTDARIGGLCLLNPWVRSEVTLARAHVKHYYAERLRQPEFWRKLLSGRVAMSALTGLADNIRKSRGSHAKDSSEADTPQAFQHRMARAWQRFDGPMLLLLSGKDHTAKEFLEAARSEPIWQGALNRSGLRMHEVLEADHTFSDPADSQQVERVTIDWLCSMIAAERTRPELTA